MINQLKKPFADEDKKEILSKGFSFLMFRLGGVFVGYLFTYFIAKQYGAAVNGLIALSFSLFLFLSTLSCLGMDTNLVRYFSKETNRVNSGLFYRVLIKGFFSSIILAFFLYQFRGFFAVTIFNKPQIEPYIYWVSLAIPFWVITIINAGYLRAIKLNGWYAFLNNPGRFLFSLIIILSLWFISDNPLNAIKAHFYGVLCLSFISLLVILKQTNIKTFKTETNSWRFIKDSIPMMLSSTILVFLGWLDTFVLGIYETDAVIGVYHVSIKIAALTTFSLQAINSILAPKIAKSYSEGDIKNFDSTIKFSTKLNFVLTIVTVLIIILFHKFLLGIFGEEFLAGSNLLIMLCIGQLISAMSGSVGTILQMIGKQKVYQNIVFIALILNIILNFILIPIYGAIGAAIATIISVSSWNLIGAYYLKKKMNITSYVTFKL